MKGCVRLQTGQGVAVAKPNHNPKKTPRQKSLAHTQISDPSDLATATDLFSALRTQKSSGTTAAFLQKDWRIE